MKFGLTKPCDNCPFRNDIDGYLTAERAEEIAHSLLVLDQTFSCHKTNDFDDEDVRETAASHHCAGALIFLEKQDNPNQWMRIGERLGLYDRTRLDMAAPVFNDEDEFIEAQPR